jgi:two-component system cell cycle response regulator DivK
MDVGLPLLDGIEATRRLKSAAETASLPVVACTASWHERLEEFDDAGFDALVSKPCTAEDLRQVLETMLAAHLPRG